MPNAEPGSANALALSTIAFAIAFAVWGLLSGLAPVLKQQLGLSSTQVSLMVAIPVLLGSVGRLPMGLLADRCGGRLVMSVLLAATSVPAFGLAFRHDYPALLAWGFLLGLGGTTFSVGVAFTSRWFAAERQGLALGIFGIGTGGQSVAVFFAPVLAARFGFAAPFLLFGTLSLAWAGVFYAFARNAPAAARPKSLADALRPLRTQPLCWLFGLFYFLTFGGFVALSIYLPSLLKEVFHLSAPDAGARTAGFVLLATGMRPVGGWISDRTGGTKVLAVVFAALALLALALPSRSMPLFTAGCLGIAVFLGLGNGAVFKLVPQYFPEEVGTVTGLVGAAGGLGGFFPPVVLGLLRDNLGSYTPGFIALTAFAIMCLVLEKAILTSPPPRPQVTPA